MLGEPVEIPFFYGDLIGMSLGALYDSVSWPFMAVTVLLIVVYYFGWARSRFQGPKVMGQEAELTDIEREFERAAGG